MDEFNEKLKQCKTLKDIFVVCEQHYKIEETKLGVMSSPLIISGIVKAIKILKPPVR